MSADRLSAALSGRYRIERELGAGGMATVYLAFDAKHDRKVAIKVLKPELAAVLGAERFVVEIKTTAAMSHPHILPLFDSGTADGFLFYVMPYIQGETIREKLNRETQFGVDEAVRIAREVADALDYAHRHGVIHRDIKPENILLHDGRAMVMDFGIALAVSAAAGGRMTETGLSLGTPHYMSPEQATAEKEITGRSDQYSLASVLYEMLAGDPPFTATAAQAVIMKIITELAPLVNTRRKNVPTNVTAALIKALEKLPADRFESAKAFADALANPAFSAGTSVQRAGAGAARARTRDPVFLATAAVAITAVAFAVNARGRSGGDAAPQPVLRVSMELPDSLSLMRDGFGARLAMSPDGSRLILVARTIGTGDARTAGTSRRLYLRRRDQLSATPLPGTEEALRPFFSLDGTRVGFTSAGSLKVVGFDGAPPQSVLDTGSVQSAAFDADGSIIAWMTGGNGLVRIAAGPSRTISQLSIIDSAARETIHELPDPLPNGRGVIFTVRHRPTSTPSLYDIAVLDLRSRKHRILVRGVMGRFVAGGYLLLVRADGTLAVAPFDQDRLVLTGEPVTLATDVAVTRGGVDLAVGEDGTMAYVPGTALARELVWSGRDGGTTPVDPGWRERFSSVALSPDGLRVAVEVDDVTGSSAVWVRRLDVGTTAKLTLGNGRFGYPSWLPDGRVTYIDETTDPFRVLAMRPEGNATADTLVRDSRSMVEARPSKDGRWVVYRSSSSVTGRGDILARRLGDTASITLVASPVDERNPSLSPDGRWLAYRSSESGTAQIYVQSFPVDSVKRMVSTAGGGEPLWSHSGKELYFMNGVAQMMAVPVTTRPTFSFGTARVLFDLPSGVTTDASGGSWDLSPDDKRFLFVRAVSDGVNDQSRERIILVSNWFEELKRLVPRK